MSERLGSLFSGKVKGIRYYETAKGEKFNLVYVEGVEKPLAVPRRRTYPTIGFGDHVSATDVTEGDAWNFIGHRSVVKVNEKQYEIWKPKTEIDPTRLLKAQILILEYARTHENLTTQTEDSDESPSGVCSNDVSNEIQGMFPERDPHIVGPIFLSLSKLKLIHPYGSKPSQPKEDKGKDHGSPIPVWHLTKHTKELWETSKDWATVITVTREERKRKRAPGT